MCIAGHRAGPGASAASSAIAPVAGETRSLALEKPRLSMLAFLLLPALFLFLCERLHRMLRIDTRSEPAVVDAMQRLSLTLRAPFRIGDHVLCVVFGHSSFS